MFQGRFFLAVLIITVAIAVIQWVFIGFLFHKYQWLTAGTWRKEDARSYAASTFISFLFAFLFTTIIYLWKSKYGNVNFYDGIAFGVICCITFSVPIEIGNSIYVNYSRMLVQGKCISSLLEYSVAGAIAATLLQNNNQHLKKV